MSWHPEATPDEVFVGNTQREGCHVAELQAKGVWSARMGKIAYCIEGNKLPADLAPLLINRRDADRYNDIMMTKAFGPHWRRNA